MFVGRLTEAKQHLIRLLFAQLGSAPGVATQEVEITLTETSKDPWGTRLQPGDEWVTATRYRCEWSWGAKTLQQVAHSGNFGYIGDQLIKRHITMQKRRRGLQ